MALNWPVEVTAKLDSLEDYCQWLLGKFRSTGFFPDVIIGHSMGGLVGLCLTLSGAWDIRQVIVVESFVTPPKPFFQNLTMEGTSPELRDKLVEMLRREQPRYSHKLGQELKKIDLTHLLEESAVNLLAIYGDRGYDETAVRQNIGWSDTLTQRLNLQTVADSCHFPMLENPQAILKIIRAELAAISTTEEKQ